MLPKVLYWDHLCLLSNEPFKAIYLHFNRLAHFILQIIPRHIKMKALLYFTYNQNRFMPLTFIYTKRSVTILSRQHGAYCSVDLVDKSPGTQWLKYANLFLIGWLAGSAHEKSCWFEMWEKHLPLNFNSQLTEFSKHQLNNKDSLDFSSRFPDF